jgi:hypothetical protein
MVRGGGVAVEGGFLPLLAQQSAYPLPRLRARSRTPADGGFESAQA